MKSKVVFVLCAVFCAFSVPAFSDDSDFNTVYDDVADITVITHSDMELKSFYNLKDNISGERENIRLSIADKMLVMIADYQNKDWLFIDSLVLLDGSGGRLKIDDGKRSGEVKKFSNVFVRETYMAVLENKTVSALSDILQAEKPAITFVGSNGRTNKLVIKQKTRAAMIATIEKWRSLQNE